MAPRLHAQSVRGTVKLVISAAQLVEAVLSLPAPEQANFVERLRAALAERGESKQEIEAAWAAVVERRLASVLAGEAELHDWDTVVEELRSR